MSQNSAISWGAADAELDHALPAAFVKDSSIIDTLSDEYWLVSGEKGAGKTALKRALTESSPGLRPNYNHIYAIDFDALGYETFEQSLSDLSRQSHLATVRVMTSYWEYVLLLEAAKWLKVTDSSFEPRIARDAISELITEGIVRSPTRFQIGSEFRRLIQKSWEVFAPETEPVRPGERPRTPADAIDRLEQFPVSYDSFRTLKQGIISYLVGRREKVLLILDGFDRLCSDNRPSGQVGAEQFISHSEHIQNIFEALAEAILAIAKQRDLAAVFRVKCFLPHDRYLAMMFRYVDRDRQIVRAFRDLDKIKDMHSAIRWTPESLRHWVARRVSISLGKDMDFEDCWSLVAVDHVENEEYGIRENAFEYILRHTMWRPRHLLTHLKLIKKAARGSLADAKVIRTAVAEGCRSLVASFVDEYAIDHPRIRDFLEMFRGPKVQNVMTFGAFTDIVQGALGRLDSRCQWTLSDKLDALFRMGLFGIIVEAERGTALPADVLYRPPLPKGKSLRPYYVEFYYSLPNQHRKVSSEVRPGDLVAMHPIFFDSFSQKADSDRIVG